MLCPGNGASFGINAAKENGATEAVPLSENERFLPSYGRGPKGEIWKIEDAIHPLVKLCVQLLSDDPLFFLINSYTTGLAPSVLSYMMGVEIVPKFGGTVKAEEVVSQN